MLLNKNLDKDPSQILLANEEDSQIVNAYIDFIAKYGRSYSSKHDINNRYQNFKINYQRVQNHNQNEDQIPFTLEMNHFSDLSEEEFQKQFTSGVKLPKRLQQLNDDNVFVLQLKKLKTQNLPEYINWYKDNKVSRPYNQGNCGSCWAFSAISALESLAVIEGIDSEIKEYSVQELLDCDNSNFGCGGGWMYEAYQYVSQYGIALKKDYRSYSAAKGSCHYNSDKIHFQNVGQLEYDYNSNEDLKALVSQQPIAIGMYATGMLSGYKRGIVTEDYLKCSSPRWSVNHGVVIVGYGKVQENDRVRGWCNEYWIIRNSWGGNWGEEGFFRLCMDDAGKNDKPYGACLVNLFATIPTMESSPE